MINCASLLGNSCVKFQQQDHLVYMMLTKESDTKFLSNLKMHDNIVYVSEEPSLCPVQGCCLAVTTGYGYSQLDLKVQLVLKTIKDFFPSFISLSKMDDDAYLDYYAFESVKRNLTTHSYVGKFKSGPCSKSNVDFAGGSFYVLGRSVIECLLSDYRTCGSGYEDRSIALSVYRNCDKYERIDLTPMMNVDLFHKVYASKDKLLYLDNKDPESASHLMPNHGEAFELKPPSLDISDQKNKTSPHA
ncbi:hypothetical protein INT44_004818 [Umbelopsis vinacea]|uniref:Uncharacterized protein n=1 Tax=Umbelopsis vinacea TaxID=44442 RepID=A0A8H7UPD6_9FUNG|nr:hypothetical protein INT44_004818 [Umbelopsis vinacea]